MSIKRIRQRYNVPAKRGMKVRSNQVGDDKTPGIILSAHKSNDWLFIRAPNGFRYIVHPLDVDYLIGNTWVSGDKPTEK